MDECSICIENLETGTLFETSCGHKFHIECIFDWLISSDDCPHCRHVLVDVACYSKPDFEIVVENCPNRETPVWRRLTMFSKSMHLHSIQRMQRFYHKGGKKIPQQLLRSQIRPVSLSDPSLNDILNIYEEWERGNASYYHSTQRILDIRNTSPPPPPIIESDHDNTRTSDDWISIGSSAESLAMRSRVTHGIIQNTIRGIEQDSTLRSRRKSLPRRAREYIRKKLSI